MAKPTIMTAVPRFYQNLYNKINMNFDKVTGFKSRLIKSTIYLGKKKLFNKKMNFLEIIYDKILNQLLITICWMRIKLKMQI